MESIPVAVLGATGMVGQRFLGLLWDHPYFDLRMVCASENSAGKRLKERIGVNEPFMEKLGDLVISKPDPNELMDNGIRIVFSALPADIATGIEKELAKKGLFVFSNARSHSGLIDPSSR